MATHKYDRHCGCATCCRIERADARADALALDLQASGAVFAEALGELTTEQHALLAGHLASGNDAGLAEILRRVQADYLASSIAGRMEDVGCTRLEAVQHLRTVYEVAPRTAPAQPWRAAA